MVKDLVCQMMLDETKEIYSTAEYKGKTYYFCTPLCKVQFESHPEKYLADNEERVHKGNGNPESMKE